MPTRWSSPDTLGGRHNRPQLGLLVRYGQRVAEDGGRESTLRRQGKVLQRLVARRLTDSCLDPLEFGRTELASIPALPRQKQFGWPAADHVGTRHQHGASLEA